MNILHVASEVAPFSKTGGLGDVLGALPRALAAHRDVKTCVVSARYGSIDPQMHGLYRRLRKIAVPIGDATYEIEVYEGRLQGDQAGRSDSRVPIYLIEHPLFGDRDGVYGPKDRPGQDYPDNALRFALLCRGALAVAQAFDLHPDVVHGHDWQGALALYYAKRHHPPHRRAPATVLTVHNLSFLGLFPLDQMAALGIDPAHLSSAEFETFEFYEQASLMKGGLHFADRITAVSPRYAREIQTPELGCGLDGLLRRLSGRMSGILNGADYDRWSPWLDPYLPLPYGKSVADPDTDPRVAMAEVAAGKARAKAELSRTLGLPLRPRVPLCATIARLTEQKGIELILKVLEDPGALRGDWHYVLVGSGEPAFEERLRALRERHPSRIGVYLGYDEALSHRVEGGADIYIMPSLFEPCGLNQMYSLRYGTVPVVRAVGGLDDTVVDYDPRSKSGTGFKFSAYEPRALCHAWNRALLAYQGDEAAWQGLVRRGMRADYSWAASARAYLGVYKQALADAQARHEAPTKG